MVNIHIVRGELGGLAWGFEKVTILVLASSTMDRDRAARVICNFVYKVARAKRLEGWQQMFDRLPHVMARHKVRYRHKSAGRTFRNFWIVDPLKRAGGITYRIRRRDLNQMRLDDGLTSRKRFQKWFYANRLDIFGSQNKRNGRSTELYCIPNDIAYSDSSTQT